MCRVSSCCFLVGTEQGTIILAIVGVIMGLLQLLSNLGRLTIVGILAAVVGVAINVLLFFGARQKRPLFVLIWLVATVVFLILTTITLVFILIAFLGQAHEQGFETLGQIILYALTLALEIYFWIVVFSFYRDLKDSGVPNIGMRSV